MACAFRLILFVCWSLTTGKCIPLPQWQADSFSSTSWPSSRQSSPVGQLTLLLPARRIWCVSCTLGQISPGHSPPVQWSSTALPRAEEKNICTPVRGIKGLQECQNFCNSCCHCWHAAGWAGRNGTTKVGRLLFQRARKEKVEKTEGKKIRNWEMWKCPISSLLSGHLEVMGSENVRGTKSLFITIFFLLGFQCICAVQQRWPEEKNTESSLITCDFYICGLCFLCQNSHNFSATTLAPGLCTDRYVLTTFSVPSIMHCCQLCCFCLQYRCSLRAYQGSTYCFLTALCLLPSAPSVLHSSFSLLSLMLRRVFCQSARFGFASIL